MITQVAQTTIDLTEETRQERTPCIAGKRHNWLLASFRSFKNVYQVTHPATYYKNGNLKRAERGKYVAPDPAGEWSIQGEQGYKPESSDYICQYCKRHIVVIRADYKKLPAPRIKEPNIIHRFRMSLTPLSLVANKQEANAYAKRVELFKTQLGPLPCQKHGKSCMATHRVTWQFRLDIPIQEYFYCYGAAMEEWIAGDHRWTIESLLP